MEIKLYKNFTLLHIYIYIYSLILCFNIPIYIYIQVEALSRLGEYNIGETLFSMFKYIASKEVWRYYSRCGQRGYINVGQTKLYKCITG